jgi:hypothetical protein
MPESLAEKVRIIYICQAFFVIFWPLGFAEWKKCIIFAGSYLKFEVLSSLR